MNASSLLASSPPITIIGAGLVGTLLANYLAHHGAQVEVFERRPDMRANTIPGGRTVAMSLSHRGWQALAGVGLEDRVRSGTHPKNARCVHQDDGPQIVQQYGQDGQALWTVNRKELNTVLIDAAEETGRVTFHFDTLVDNLDVMASTFERSHGADAPATHRFTHLIAADGMNSRIRASLCRSGDIADEMTTLDYRYFELTVPPDDQGAWALPADQVHIWPRREGLMVALPNMGGTFTGTFFYGRKNGDEYDGKHDAAVRTNSFRGAFPEVAQLIPDLEQELSANPASDIKAVRCWPWNVDNKVLLVGDACHAIVPFYAMGMNAGFEDCTVLSRLIVESGGDLTRVFQQFAEVRKPDTDAIGDLSLRNFTSIGQSADPEYDRRWQLERALWGLFPDQWTPLYVMIHFDHLPLAEVVRRQDNQAAILTTLMAQLPVDGAIDLDNLSALARPLLP